MSNLLGSTSLGGPAQVLKPNDMRLLDDGFNGRACFSPVIVSTTIDAADVNGIDHESDPWWPASSGLVGNGGMSDISTQLYWEAVTHRQSGASGRLGFVGITRDQYGSPLGACTVRCFHAQSGTLQSTVVSDANGFYVATTPLSDAHFLTVHGPLGTAGATVDTLVGG